MMDKVDTQEKRLTDAGFVESMRGDGYYWILPDGETTLHVWIGYRWHYYTCLYKNHTEVGTYSSGGLEHVVNVALQMQEGLK